MDLSRREFLAGCAGCGLALTAGGCTAVNPAPLVTLDSLAVIQLLRNPGDQIKVQSPDSPELILVWFTGKSIGAASITCTHRGSEVHYNKDTNSLDCPSHGSRFDPSGKVLEGPAKQPLVPWRLVVEDGHARLLRA